MSAAKPTEPHVGPVVFGDGWRGLFLDGLGAVFYGTNLSAVLDAIERGEPVTPINVAVLRSLAADLARGDHHAPDVHVQMLRPFDECLASALSAPAVTNLPYLWDVTDAETGTKRPAGVRHEAGDTIRVREVWYYSDTGEEHQTHEVSMGLNSFVHLAINMTPVERALFAEERTEPPKREWEGCPTANGSLVGRGPGVGLRSGTMWYPFAPSVDDVHGADFEALAYQCRWSGHCRVWMSIAEHCVRVARMLAEMGATREVVLQGLVHDLREVYPPGDTPGPMLHGDHPWSVMLRSMEEKAAMALHTAIAVPVKFDPLVRECDLRSLAWEARWLMPTFDGHFDGLPEPPAEKLVPWTREEAWRAWVELYDQLGGVWPT